MPILITTTIRRYWEQARNHSPSATRRFYARRTGAERTFSTAKDPASNKSPAAGAASWA